MLDFRQDKYLIRALDDDEEHLEALEFVLNAEGWRMKGYSDCSSFLEDFDSSEPGCILLDIKMPDQSGTEVQEILNEMGNFLPIIFLTGHGDLNLAVKTFRAGAFDFLQKPLDPEELFNSINRALESCDKEFKRRLESSPAVLYNTLTNRQKQVVLDMAKGVESHFIAEHLGISPRTLQRHRQNCLRKLGLRTPDQLPEFLRQIGFEF